jgi:hypothetical protein
VGVIALFGASRLTPVCPCSTVAKAKAGRDLIRKLNQIQHEKAHGRSRVKASAAPGTRPRTASSGATHRSQSSTKPQAVVRAYNQLRVRVAIILRALYVQRFVAEQTATKTVLSAPRYPPEPGSKKPVSSTYRSTFRA